MKTSLRFEETRQWAEKGNPMAQFNLGLAYSLGDCVPQDGGKALKWWRKAAAQGHEKARCALAWGWEAAEALEWNYDEDPEEFSGESTQREKLVAKVGDELSQSENKSINKTMMNAPEDKLLLEPDESVVSKTEKQMLQPYVIVILCVTGGIGLIGENLFLLVAVIGFAFVLLLSSRVVLWLTTKRIVFAEKAGALGRWNYGSISLSDVVLFWKGVPVNFADSDLNLANEQRQKVNLVTGSCDLTIATQNREAKSFTDKVSSHKTKSFEALKNGHEFVASLASTLRFTSTDGRRWDPEEGRVCI